MGRGEISKTFFQVAIFLDNLKISENEVVFQLEQEIQKLSKNFQNLLELKKYELLCPTNSIFQAVWKNQQKVAEINSLKQGLPSKYLRMFYRLVYSFQLLQFLKIIRQQTILSLVFFSYRRKEIELKKVTSKHVLRATITPQLNRRSLSTLSSNLSLPSIHQVHENNKRLVRKLKFSTRIQIFNLLLIFFCLYFFESEIEHHSNGAIDRVNLQRTDPGL